MISGRVANLGRFNVKEWSFLKTLSCHGRKWPETAHVARPGTALCQFQALASWNSAGGGREWQLLIAEWQSLDLSDGFQPCLSHAKVQKGKGSTKISRGVHMKPARAGD